MRQVPAFDAVPIGLVGDGRVARHFHHYFNLLGLAVRGWSRRTADATPVEALAGCRTILLLIQDAAIVPFVDAWPALKAKRLVHCSGSVTTTAARAAHPLMTFGSSLYSLETYLSVPFVLDDDGPPFHDLLPDLPNPSFTIPASERRFYHALCVMAGNFSSLLWLKLVDELQQRYRIPASAAHPYLSRVTANLIADGRAALTGPLVRGDESTISANVHALEGDPFQAVYTAFVRAYAERS